jgi:hypothetical protein
VLSGKLGAATPGGFFPIPERLTRNHRRPVNVAIVQQKNCLGCGLGAAQTNQE